MRPSRFLETGFAGCALATMLLGCGSKDAAPETAGAAPGSGQVLNTGTPVDGTATLAVAETARVGATIEVGWTGPGNGGDYIDLVPRGVAETSGEISYVYVRDAIPVGKLRLPTSAGDYDVRYVVQLADERRVRATKPLTVIGVTAGLVVPTRAEAGEPLTIGWQGPAGEGDYLDLVPAGHAETSAEITYAYTRDGNPARLTAPGRSGNYLIRYVLEGPGGRKVLAMAALTVIQPTATLSAPEVVSRGASIQVQWTGPRRQGDYIDLVRKGHVETSGELSYFYTDRESPGSLTAPAETGEYEIRYVLEAPGGRQVLARRPIRVITGPGPSGRA